MSAAKSAEKVEFQKRNVCNVRGFIMEDYQMADFIEVDDNGFVKKAERSCSTGGPSSFILNFEEFADKLKEKITPNKWEELCNTFATALESEMENLLYEALDLAELANDEDGL